MFIIHILFDQIFGVGALAHRGLLSLHRGACAGSFPAPHHHDPNEMLLNFCILGYGGCKWWMPRYLCGMPIIAVCRYGRRPVQPSSSSLARRACVNFDFVFWYAVVRRGTPWFAVHGYGLSSSIWPSTSRTLEEPLIPPGIEGVRAVYQMLSLGPGTVMVH